MISSYVGENALFEKLTISGENASYSQLHKVLAEKSVLEVLESATFYMATGYGTIVADGKETKRI